jgi:molybdopterin-guanine dinucleotide biosynthesis protein A
VSGAGPVGVVLAGGAGSRLGGAKPGTVLAGRPLASYPLAALRGGGLGEIAIVAKASSDLGGVDTSVVVWVEPDEPRHPLAGVVEALRRGDGRAVLVLACDLAFVTAEVVRALVTADAGGAPAVVAVDSGGRSQPLCARYEPAALELLAGFDASGRAVDQVAALHPATLAVADETLRNVNTPDDLAAAEAILNG